MKKEAFFIIVATKDPLTIVVRLFGDCTTCPKAD
jgi:hypothetical protein